MLPGGLDIIGVFVTAPPQQMSAAQSKLKNVRPVSNRAYMRNSGWTKALWFGVVSKMRFISVAQTFCVSVTTDGTACGACSTAAQAFDATRL